MEKENTMPTSIDVGEYFTDKIIDNGGRPSIMQILKLSYIAQGFHLSLEDKPFFDDKVYAWKHGPVIKNLYEHLKKRCNDNSPFIKGKYPSAYLFNDKQKDILRVVFQEYASLNAWDLSALTHRQGTPWAEIFDEKNRDKIIDVDSIKNHFKQIISPITFAISLSEK